MRVSYFSLQNMLKQNMVDIQFVRRRPSSQGTTRRMLCTNCQPLLLSNEGRQVLNYRIPTGSLPYAPALYNLVVVWDILMQDFRQIPVDSANVLNIVPFNEDFWPYFQKTILPMTSDQKIRFMQGL